MGSRSRSAAARSTLRRHAPRLAALAALAGLALTVTPPLTPPAHAQASSPLEYTLVDQWPSPDWPLDALGQPAGLAASADGRVFLADRVVNRVTVMAPDGTWSGEFGNRGTGPELLGDPSRIEIDDANDRLYVADVDSYRVVVYDRAGRFVDAWPGIYAAGLSLGPNGLLWVADVFTDRVRAFDPGGHEVVAFGQRGSAPSTFRQLADVSVAPGGDIYVGDRRGSRIQVFRPDGALLAPPGTADFTARAEQAPAPRLVKTYDLNDARYRQTTGGGGPGGGRPPGGGPGGGGPGGGGWMRRCSGADIDVIDDDSFLAFPCLITDSAVEFLRGPQASLNVFGFFRPYVNARAGLFYSMSTYDDNRDDPRNPTFPAIVRYVDKTFSTTSGVWTLAPFDNTQLRSPTRVDVHPNGTLYVTDFRQVQRYSQEGVRQNPLPSRTFPTEPISITLRLLTGDGTPDGVVGYGTCLNAGSPQPNPMPCLGQFEKRTRDHRGTPLDYLEPLWTTTVSPEAAITELHYDPVNDLILVLNNADQEILAYKRLARGRKDTWPLGGSDRTAIFADVGSGPDGRIYVLDVLRDQIQVRDARGDLTRTLPSPSDAWRVAGGPGGTVLVLTAFGEVAVLDQAGAEVARFSARANENAQARSLSDLSVSADGRVFVADARASLMMIFAPTGRPASEVLAGQTCLVRGDKTATPARVALADEIDMTLTLRGTCGAIEQASNILLLVNTKSSAALDAARQVVALADFKRNQVGLMGYYVNTLFKVRWTHDPTRVVSGLETVNAGGGAESNEANALKEAARELALEPGRGVVVLIGAQYCVKTDQNSCAEQTDAEPAAAELRAAGARVVVVNGSGDSAILASNDLDVVSLFGGSLGSAVPVYQRVASFLRPASLLKSATVADVIPPQFDVVPGSLRPAGTWDPATRTLAWAVADGPYTGTLLRYRLKPNAAGRWATNVEATADFVDGWDGAGRVTFPVPEVEVVAPPTETPVPTPVPTDTPVPTATPAATDTPVPTETPVPTATPVPAPAYLPIAFLDRCVERTAPYDIALVFDVSSSMGAATRAGGPAKLAAAKAAADGFVDALQPLDRVAVIAFDEAAAVALPLSGDRAAARSAIAGLATGSGSRIDRGLAAGSAALAARRPDAAAAMVLLTDGRATGPEVGAAARAADAARQAGTVVYAVGLGDDVDRALLARVAGDPGRYFEAPQAGDLARVYAGLPVVRSACP